MTTPSPLSRRDWLAGIVAGVVLGVPILGLGGRAGMRMIAIANDQVPAFSVEGSLTVLLLGAAAGAAVAVIFLTARAILPRRRGARVAFFTIVTGALVLRGLKPVSYTNVAVFGPLFVLFGTLLQLYWCRVYLRRRVRIPQGA